MSRAAYPEDFRVAEAKARLVHGRHPSASVLAADTIVVVDDLILGKDLRRTDMRTIPHSWDNDMRPRTDESGLYSQLGVTA